MNLNLATFRMMQTNYVGPFMLTSILLPLLKNSRVPSRVVNLTSFTHRCGKFGVLLLKIIHKLYELSLSLGQTIVGLVVFPL
jgi:NAD(P)-dependent dehydrogenase (short-subunit alcohol dehydrogenase family)